MVIVTRIDSERDSVAVEETVIAPIGDLKDFILLAENTGGDDLNWEVHAWRVGSISRIDSGKNRHPATIPAWATEILASVAIVSGAMGVNQKLDNKECYTHIGIKHDRVTTDTTLLLLGLGRLEEQ